MDWQIQKRFEKRKLKIEKLKFMNRKCKYIEMASVEDLSSRLQLPKEEASKEESLKFSLKPALTSEP